MSEPERIGIIAQVVMHRLNMEARPQTAMGPAAAGAQRKPSEGARPAGEAEDTQPAGKGPIEAEESEPSGSLTTGGRSVDALASHQCDDLNFARAVLPLLIQSARYAGYTQSNSYEEKHIIKVLLVHPDRDVLIVTLGRYKSHAFDPRRKRWSIPNRPRWRRSFCHLQDKLFKGHVPSWLRPGCTSCGRVIT